MTKYLVSIGLQTLGQFWQGHASERHAW